MTRYDPIRDQVVDVVENAGPIQNYGFETEITWLATDSWSLGGNYSYTDSKYSGETSVVVVNDPAIPPSVFGDPKANPELFIFNIDRNELKGIPGNKWAVWVGYEFDTALGHWQAQVNYSYTGEYAGSPLGLGLDRIPARQRLDLALTWNDPDRHWNVRAFIDNATNENNLRGVAAGEEKDNWRLTGTPLYPRYWGVDIRRDF